jgi:LacI family transcriptional regulator
MDNKRGAEDRNRTTEGSVTLSDVAKLAGVAKSTVSRVLAAQEGTKVPFAAATQARVRCAARKLGYRPSKLARGLTAARTGIVGLVIPSVTDSFFPRVTNVIETWLGQQDCSVILANTQGIASTEESKIDNLLDWRVDGLIVAPCQESLDAALYWDLWRGQTPFVLIDRAFPSTPFYSVTTDDYAGATLAVEHLLSIGRKRIALAVGPQTIHTNRLRCRGYNETLVRHGLMPDPDLILTAGATGDWRDVARRLLSLRPMPDALFCASDLIAVDVMQECFNQSVRIPEDLALVGYADLPNSEALRVPLTTVRQPRDMLGQSAAEMLLAAIHGSPIEQPQLVLPVELVVRESTVGP